MTYSKTRCKGWLCFVYYRSSANAANTIVCKTAMTGSCSVWFQFGSIGVEFFAQICWLLGGFGSIYLPLMKKCRLVYFSISQTFYWILMPAIQDSDANSDSKDSQIFWFRFWIHGVWFWFHGCHNNNSLGSMVFCERNCSQMDTIIMISVIWLWVYLFFIYHGTI